MVNICVYPGCRKRQFHRLPLRYDRALVDKWLVVLKMDVNTSTETLRQRNYRICGNHFDKDDFVYPRQADDPKIPANVYLKKNAIPRVEQRATDSVEVTFSIGRGKDTKHVLQCKPQTEGVVVVR